VVIAPLAVDGEPGLNPGSPVAATPATAQAPTSTSTCDGDFGDEPNPSPTIPVAGYAGRMFVDLEFLRNRHRRIDSTPVAVNPAIAQDIAECIGLPVPRPAEGVPSDDRRIS
jgi:hypothetical protein